jgi:hypothetical protein
VIPNPVEFDNPDVPAGNAFLGESLTITGVPYTLSVFSQAFVLSNRNYLGGPSGDIPMVDLELGFMTGGVQRSFSVTLVGKVDNLVSSERGGERFVDQKGVINVHDVEYVRGEYVSLTLAHFPGDFNDKRRVFERYCLSEDDYVCGYLDFGFGDNQIDTSEVDPNFIEYGRKFLSSEVAVVGLVRSSSYPNFFTNEKI